MDSADSIRVTPGSDAPTERDVALGQAVATARSMIGYSIEGAAEALGIERTILQDIESGHVLITSALRLRLERCFGVGLDDVVVDTRVLRERTPLEYNEELGVLRVGKLGVAFRKGVNTNDDLFRGFSAAVRGERGLSSDVPLRIRTADLPILAQLVDLDDPDLDERAQFWFGQTPETKQGFAFILSVAKDAAELNA